MPNDWHYAVVIGVDYYPGLDDSLSYPRHDAQGFIDWLVAADGGDVPEDNIQRVMLESEPDFTTWDKAEPTAAELDKALAVINATYRARVENDFDGFEHSRLYVYASGHGIATSTGLGSVLFAGVAPKLGYWDHAEIDGYKTWYITAKLFKELVIFSDCCRERRPLVAPNRPRLGDLGHPFGDEAQVWVMFGAEHGRKAYEPAPGQVDAKRGFFTAALLDGLRGGAVDPATKVISGTSLFNYVKKAMLERTGNTSYPQKPDQDGNPDLVIRTNGNPAKIERNVRLVFPAGYTGRVRLWLRGENLGDWDTTDGPWSRPLAEALEYVLAPLDGQAPLPRGGAFQVVGKDGDVDLS
jgi:hypothetical protein